jgi:uncharacterized protein with NRDE domain
MCLLALFFRVVPDAAVVVGANREEAYARGGQPPRILAGPCAAVAGVDPVAGGTWLGVNARGVLVAITNRPKTEPPPEPPSRGLLVRELLAYPSAAAAGDRALRELDHNRYAGCNLLCIDERSALVIHAGDWLRVRPLPPGLHVLTANDVNDASDRRLGHALWWLGQRGYASAEQCVSALKELCSQPGNGGPPMCLHGDRGGTVSSSIVALRTPLAHSTYWHSQGPPDRTAYTDYSGLVRQLSAGTNAEV